ncbi:hypothetical protein ACOMHN_020677 [Nucella lapillus]
MIRRRDRLYKKWKKTKDEGLQNQIKAMKRHIQRILRRAYWSFTENLITDSPNSYPTTKRSFWSYIKSQRTEAANVSPLKVDGKLVTDPKDKAKALNAQFQSAFSKKFPSKAPGPDGISPRLLRDLANEISPALTLLYQSSINTGIVPQNWRTANVTPVFKKGERHRPENYRPISLTSVPCKILEHIVVSTIMGFAEANNILRTEQHGFRKGRSCESQLLGLIDELTLNMAKRNQSDVLVMDFSKAFNKVCYSLLVHKIRHYGISGQINALIRNFLTDRQQAVVVEGSTFKAVPVESGVPQGSVLGPALFLLYINDLPENLSSTTRLFADDTLCHRVINSNDDQAALQQDLDHMADWELKWKMSFHPEKCQALHVTRKKKPLTKDYILHDQKLKPVEETKYFGVTISRDLNWESHITNIANKANSTLGFLRRNLKIGSIAIKEMAYKTLVRPTLEYASPVWDPHTDKAIGKLEKVQRRADRWVTGRHRQTSIVEDMYTQLKWSSLQTRRTSARLTTFYKHHHGNVVINTPHRPVPNPQSIKTRQSHQETYVLPLCNTNYRKNSFFPRTIKDWNSLPPEEVSSASVEDFKTRI